MPVPGGALFYAANCYPPFRGRARKSSVMRGGFPGREFPCIHRLSLCFEFSQIYERFLARYHAAGNP
jgi:hypothetical protein